MLRELTIENVAVIEKAVVSFDSGFNVLTGETGAGKSILIDSINAILGNRTSKEIVRNGASKARIWAVFTRLPALVQKRLEEDGYASEEDLLLYREITGEGKSSCRINGKPAAAAYLREISEALITIHGQHENQTLLSPSRHMAILDTYAQNRPIYDSYYGCYKELVGVERELRSLVTDEKEKQARIDLLKYQIGEIEAAGLKPGEEETLQAERTKMQHAQKILDALKAAYEALNGTEEDEGQGAVDLLGQAMGQTESITEVYPEIVRADTALREAFYSSQETAEEIKTALDSFDIDSQALEETEERLNLFYHLKQKYGDSEEAILDYLAGAKEELDKIEFSDEYRSKLLEKKKELLPKAVTAAEKLTQSRLTAFAELQKKLQSTLAYLNMAGVEFSLRHTRGALASAGQDTMEFYIVTNRGETPKPLARIASGGELSRIMLALKNALADSEDIGTAIYDEIDTGVSGIAAGRIGSVLQQTSDRGRQIICVTHTAQIAACADYHLLIEKSTQNDRTYTKITPLDTTGRVRELARIISGNYVTDLSLAGAQEMLGLFARKANFDNSPA